MVRKRLGSDPSEGSYDKPWSRIFGIYAYDSGTAYRSYNDNFPFAPLVPRGELEFADPGEAETIASRLYSKFGDGPLHTGLMRRSIRLSARVRNLWVKTLRDEGFSLVARDFTVPILKGDGGLLFNKSVWAGTKGVISFDGESDGEKLHTLMIFSATREYAEKWVLRWKECVPDRDLNRISSARIKGVFLTSQGNLSTRNFVEPVGFPLDSRNYSAEVFKFYGDMVDGLAEKNPRGRLAILEGPPGTGKTFLLRGLVHDLAEKAEFIYLPASLVANMDGPQMISLLERDEPVSENDPVLPKILIVEDADECLVSRGADNMSSIRSLLNCCDGFLGSVLDLRVVATTNSGHVSRTDKIDSALLRPGRLFGRGVVGKIPESEARIRIANLVGIAPEEIKFPTPQTSYSLAEIYNEARNLGWKS